MRVVFIGCVEFSERMLSRLLKNTAIEVVGVVTRKESPVNSDFCDLSLICQECGVPYLHSEAINSEQTLEWVQDTRPDIILCIGWSTLLKSRLLELAPQGVIGYHPAELPKNRGRHPIIWAIALGLKRTASTFFFMDEGADSGDIVSQRLVAIDHEEDSQGLYEKLILVAEEQLEELVASLVDGKLKRMVQDHSKANTWRKRTRKDGVLDWRMSADSIWRLVRALTKPYVGAHFVLDSVDIKVWRVVPVLCDNSNVEPGKVLSVIDGQPVIKCGNDAVRLLEWDRPAKTELPEYL